MIRLAVTVKHSHAEQLLAQLLELTPNGVEEIDYGDSIEYAIYGSAGEIPSLPDLDAVADGIKFQVSTSECPDDWDRRWREFHQPVTVAERVYLRPPWREQPSDPNLIDVVIDPAQAFGTGAHPTTRLCLELLLRLEAGGKVIDLGCGSGVLAIAAAKLGYGPITALDNDPEAVTATISNAKINNTQLDTQRFDLRSQRLEEAPIVVANLVRPLLLEFARRLEHVPNTLIVSGLLIGEGQEVATAFAEHGLVECGYLSEGDWEALLLQRK